MKSKNNKKLNTDYQLLNTHTGFTLVETLVAITVLLLSIAAPLTIAARSLFSAYYARDQITAYYLAEEAIEYVKNARDTTFLNDVLNSSVPVANNTDWLLGLHDCIDNGVGFVGCYVDSTKPFDPYHSTDAVQSCTAGGLTDCPPIDHCESDANNVDSGLWGYNINAVCQHTPAVSKFTRKVVIKPQSNANGLDEAIITVTITWQGAGLVSGAQTYELKGAILNWERK